MAQQRSALRPARRTTPLTLAALALLVVTGDASADVVTGPPPEDDCPEGSTGGNCRGYGHGSDHCSPNTCTRDEDCGEGGLCQEAALCISQVECSSEPDGGALYEDNVVGPCDEGGSCSTGVCETLRVCATSPVFQSAGGCSCALSGGQRAGGALAAILTIVAALALLRRRR